MSMTRTCQEVRLQTVLLPTTVVQDTHLMIDALLTIQGELPNGTCLRASLGQAVRRQPQIGALGGTTTTICQVAVLITRR